MFDRLLVPLDGSDLSMSALQHAVGLARLSGATIVLLQAVESEAHMLAHASSTGTDPLPNTVMSAAVAHEAVEAQRIAAADDLEAVAVRLRDEGVAAVEVAIAEGQAGTAIVAAVEEHECDAVVIATHGRSGIRRAILGSVADHVLRHVDVPVLLVRARER